MLPRDRDAVAEAIAPVGPGGAAFGIDQRLVEGDDAEPGGDITDPIVLDVAVEQQNARGVALEGRAIEVAFHAEDEWSGLPIVTGLNTAKKAGEGLRRQRQGEPETGDEACQSVANIDAGLRGAAFRPHRSH
jgi:hypothetical protein